MERLRHILWQKFFTDPSKWWDNRHSKTNPNYPDFKHKTTGESLWIDGLHNPPWIHAQLSNPAQQNSRFQETAKALVALLKICTKKKDLHAGRSLHSDILKRGLLEKNPFVASTLVSMYAKCGDLEKAKEVLEGFPVRNVVLWNALITGYAQIDQGQEALDCVACMKHEGLCPDEVTFACILKACAVVRALHIGEKVHSDIVSQGLLEGDVVLGNALVDMYAKCGALAKAKEVLKELPKRILVSWNALIAGYAQGDDGKEALCCFDEMRHDGISPNAVTYTCVLKACGIIRALRKGEEIHSEIVEQGWLEKDSVLGNALVDMYGRCSAFIKAKEVLEELPVRGVAAWNSLIAGYTQSEFCREALTCFQEMQEEGLCPDAITFTCALKACGRTGALDKGTKIHIETANQRLLGGNVVLGNVLVDMYAKCDALPKAKEVLEEISIRNVTSWNTFITGYAQSEHGEEAVECFQLMQHEGLSPNAMTFTSTLKACGSIGAFDKGEQLHHEIARCGLLSDDAILGNALVDMYAKSGALIKASKVLEELPVRGKASWNALIAGYAQQENGENVLNCFEQMKLEGLSPDVITFSCILKACACIEALGKGETTHREIVNEGLLAGDIVLSNALVDMYAKCGALDKAKEVFEALVVRDEVSWNALISGHVQEEHCIEALDYFEQMQLEVVLSDFITFPCILKACRYLGALDKGKRIHYEIVRQGLLGENVVLGNALVDLYAKCGAFGKTIEVFESIPVRNEISWNTLIAGFTEGEFGEVALDCFEWMHLEGICPSGITFVCILRACGIVGSLDSGKKVHSDIVKLGLLRDDVVVGNALIDMYAKCNALDEAKEVLDRLPSWDMVSWNALIAGYAQGEYGIETLYCFEQMQNKGVSPDAVTFACILKACGAIGAFDKGEEIHAEIVRQGLLSENAILGNALVDMYAKCSALGKAKELFDSLFVRDVISWNALIAGYMQREQVMEALNCFEWMLSEGASPDAISFLCVLTVCSHSGLIDKGQEYFMIMSRDYGITPDLDHYTCMVSLFGRMGLLNKAVETIEKMPSSKYLPVWIVLLHACKKWGNVDVGKWAFERAIQLDIKAGAPYMYMSDIYAAAGFRDEADKINAMRVKNGAWKKQGESWLFDYT